MRGSEKVPKKSEKKKQASTFFIYGMWLYGAKWDQLNETICDLGPEDLIGNEIPTI